MVTNGQGREGGPSVKPTTSRRGRAWREKRTSPLLTDFGKQRSKRGKEEGPGPDCQATRSMASRRTAPGASPGTLKKQGGQS